MNHIRLAGPLLLMLLAITLPSCRAAREENPTPDWKRDPTRLDRMPQSFGKRSHEGPGLADPAMGDGVDQQVEAVVEKRYALLDRMPQSFGKRVVWNQRRRAIGRRFSNKRLAVLERMPVSYGKRGEPGSGAEEPQAGEELQKARMDEKRALLDRMPLSYGKRVPSVGSFSGVGDLDEGFDDKRNVLDRMPLNFGKRRMDLGSPQSAVTAAGFDDKRALLDRMPLSYGKRLNPEDADVFDGASNEKRALLDRMPLSFGKRDPSLKPSTTEDMGLGLDEKRARLDRMPLSYGKRGSNPSPAHAGGSVEQLEGEKRALLDRMPLHYGKRNSNAGAAEGVEDNKRALAVLDRMPISYGKRLLDSNHSLKPGWRLGLKRAALLDRMPLSFGKRTASSHFSLFLKR